MPLGRNAILGAGSAGSDVESNTHHHPYQLGSYHCADRLKNKLVEKNVLEPLIISYICIYKYVYTKKYFDNFDNHHKLYMYNSQFLVTFLAV